MTDKTLIFGNSYVASEERAWLVSVWAKLVIKLNPGTDVLVIDTPADPSFFPVLPDNIQVIRYEENVGHLMTGGKDGAGRAWSTGIQYAIDNGYTSLAFIETDLLLAWPVAGYISEMYKAGKWFAQTPGPPYPWNESGVWFADVARLRDTNFVDRYDWSSIVWGDWPEWRLPKVVGDGLHMLSLNGRRAEDGAVTEENAGELDWITHSVRPIYEAFLRKHGHEDVLM